MIENAVRKAMAAGVPTFGTWQTIASSFTAEMLAKQGFDWLLIDTQHGGIAWESLGGIIQGVEVGGVRALVRVGWNDQRLIMRALDLGAAGVIVPMVSTAEDARHAAEAMRYPPAGVRSFGPIRQFYSTDAANSDVVCMVMIETAQALENLDAIAGTPGVDGLFVGPMDLALSLGRPLSMTMPDEVLKAIDKIVAACEKAGIIAGSVSWNSQNAEELLARGVRFLTVGADISYLTNAARQDVEAIGKLRTRFKKTT